MSDPLANLADTREKHVLRQFQEDYQIAGLAACFAEPPGPALNHLFILSVDGTRWVGRKLPMPRCDGRWYLSSCLKPHMLLGPLTHVVYGDSGVELHFITTTKDQKHSLLHNALEHADSELYYPFPVLDHTGREKVMNAEDWLFSQALAHGLDADEQHFRDYCANLLQHTFTSGTVLFDPACSTGAFIASMALALPHARCIGSDRSPSMIEHASTHYTSPRLQFQHQSAEDMLDAITHCDVLFLRFLNAEVMNRDEANQLIQLLLSHLNTEATVIIFGHTPVLPNIRYWAQCLGLTLNSSVAARPGHDELFEFYVLKTGAR